MHQQKIQQILTILQSDASINDLARLLDLNKKKSQIRNIATLQKKCISINGFNQKQASNYLASHKRHDQKLNFKQINQYKQQQTCLKQQEKMSQKPFSSKLLRINKYNQQNQSQQFILPLNDFATFKHKSTFNQQTSTSLNQYLYQRQKNQISTLKKLSKQQSSFFNDFEYNIGKQESQLSLAKQKIEILAIQNQKLQKQVFIIKQKYFKLFKDLKNVQMQNSHLKHCNQQKQQKINSAHTIKTHNIHKLNQQITYLNETLSKQKQKYQSRITQMNQKLDFLNNQLMQQHHKHIKQNKLKKQQIHKLNKDKLILNQDKQRAFCQLNNVIKDKQDLKQLIQQLKQNNFQQRTTNEILNKKLNILYQNCQNSKTTNDKLIKQSKLLKEQIQAIRHQQSQLQFTNKILQQNNQNTKQQLDHQIQLRKQFIQKISKFNKTLYEQLDKIKNQQIIFEQQNGNIKKNEFIQLQSKFRQYQSKIRQQQIPKYKHKSQLFSFAQQKYLSKSGFNNFQQNSIEKQVNEIDNNMIENSISSILQNNQNITDRRQSSKVFQSVFINSRELYTPINDLSINSKRNKHQDKQKILEISLLNLNQCLLTQQNLLQSNFLPNFQSFYLVDNKTKCNRRKSNIQMRECKSKQKKKLIISQNQKNQLCLKQMAQLIGFCLKNIEKICFTNKILADKNKSYLSLANQQQTTIQKLQIQLQEQYLQFNDWMFKVENNLNIKEYKNQQSICEVFRERNLLEQELNRLENHFQQEQYNYKILNSKFQKLIYVYNQQKYKYQGLLEQLEFKDSQLKQQNFNFWLKQQTLIQQNKHLNLQLMASKDLLVENQLQKSRLQEKLKRIQFEYEGMLQYCQQQKQNLRCRIQQLQFYLSEQKDKMLTIQSNITQFQSILLQKQYQHLQKGQQNQYSFKFLLHQKDIQINQLKIQAHQQLDKLMKMHDSFASDQYPQSPKSPYGRKTYHDSLQIFDYSGKGVQFEIQRNQTLFRSLSQKKIQKFKSFQINLEDYQPQSNQFQWPIEINDCLNKRFLPIIKYQPTQILNKQNQKLKENTSLLSNAFKPCQYRLIQSKSYHQSQKPTQQVYEPQSSNNQFNISQLKSLLNNNFIDSEEQIQIQDLTKSITQIQVQQYNN